MLNFPEVSAAKFQVERVAHQKVQVQFSVPTVFCNSLDFKSKILMSVSIDSEGRIHSRMQKIGLYRLSDR